MTHQPEHAATISTGRPGLVVVALLVVVAAVAGVVYFFTRPAAKVDVAPPACVEALRKQLAEGIAQGEDPSAAPAKRPAACDNVTDKGLEDAATKILGEAFGS